MTALAAPDRMPETDAARCDADGFAMDRGAWMVAACGCLAAALLVAFYWVCLRQVEVAQARHEAQRLERLALYDCWSASQGATLAACARAVPLARAPHEPQDGVPAEAAFGGHRSQAATASAAAGLVPVSLALR